MSAFFSQLPVRFSSCVDNNIREFLNTSVANFFNELGHFCTAHNNDKYGEWFSERTYLSMFFNGIIRSDGAFRHTVVQEYCVNGVGRCDAFISFDKKAILIESKMHRYRRPLNDSHYEDIESWIEWDENEIRSQLTDYYEAEKWFFEERKHYDQCYLLTMVFKAIKENQQEHLNKVEKHIIPEHINKLGRDWYYAVAFHSEDKETEKKGLEVYGTIERRFPMI